MATDARAPPLFDLGDPAVRWAQTDAGLLIDRRFRVRTLTLPLTLVAFGGFGLWSAIQEGSWFIGIVMGAGVFLWSGFLLIRVRSHDTLLFGREELEWHQHWPRAFAGRWSRSDVDGVRVVYDRRPRWHDRLHVAVDLRHEGRWIRLATADTYGLAPARRRAERLAEEISLSLGRPAGRLVADDASRKEPAGDHPSELGA